ncbi:nit protein 1 [Kwoniella heveanensis CBS 569]|nr:nit protein 1 [Kwoniella heveanensis CBS 569]
MSTSSASTAAAGTGAHARTGTRVAVAQIRSTADPADNLRRSVNVIQRAVEAGAKAVFLPEAADFINQSKEESRRLSSPLAQHAYTLGLQKLAKDLGVVISAGVHEGPEDEQEQRFYNTHVVIGGSGELLAMYRKLHLFDVELTKPPNPDGTVPPPQRTGESDRILRGESVTPPVTVDGLGKLGLEICYDIRFPELSIILTRLGATTLLFPSAFTVKTGRDHWATLCRSQAIQAQSYVIASAQYGAHNEKRTSWGESIAFDPWGRELGKLRQVDDTPPGSDEGIEKVYEEGGEFFVFDLQEDIIQ